MARTTSDKSTRNQVIAGTGLLGVAGAGAYGLKRANEKKLGANPKPITTVSSTPSNTDSTVKLLNSKVRSSTAPKQQIATDLLAKRKKIKSNTIRDRLRKLDYHPEIGKQFGHVQIIRNTVSRGKGDVANSKRVLGIARNKLKGLVTTAIKAGKYSSDLNKKDLANFQTAKELSKFKLLKSLINF